jgi:hypothetical protein
MILHGLCIVLSAWWCCQIAAICGSDGLHTAVMQQGSHGEGLLQQSSLCLFRAASVAS